MNTGWVRVGTAVKAARAAQKLKQQELADRVGVSVGTIASIERGTEFAKVTTTLRAIERVLGWGAGSIESIRDGGDSLPADQPANTGPAPAEVVNGLGSVDGLPLRVLRALQEGTTLDSEILPLSPGAEVIVIPVGKAGATSAQLQAALRAWEERHGYLDRLGEVPDDSSDPQ